MNYFCLSNYIYPVNKNNQMTVLTCNVVSSLDAKYFEPTEYIWIIKFKLASHINSLTW